MQHAGAVSLAIATRSMAANSYGLSRLGLKLPDSQRFNGGLVRTMLLGETLDVSRFIPTIIQELQRLTGVDRIGAFHNKQCFCCS